MSSAQLHRRSRSSNLTDHLGRVVAIGALAACGGSSPPPLEPAASAGGASAPVTADRGVPAQGGSAASQATPSVASGSAAVAGAQARAPQTPPPDEGSSTGLDAGSAPTPEGATHPADACSGHATYQARVACATNAMLATLTPAQLSAVKLELTDYVNRTKWNNLPVALRPRAGVQVGTLSQQSQSAVFALMNTALDTEGRATMTRILRGDDFLRGSPLGYGTELYTIAVFGTPSDHDDFEVMLGGHHMGFNLNFVDGKFAPVPEGLGVEPKEPFMVNGESIDATVPHSDALFAIFDALDADQRSRSYLLGQTFADVVVAPDLDYGNGAMRTSKSAYPSGDNRRGILVSDLHADQQKLVAAAIERFVRQYPPEVADPLVAAYTAAYSDTYFAWGGAEAGLDRTTQGGYLRIDGPRLWIELCVSPAQFPRTLTHYHSLYRDKSLDYGGQF